MKKQWKTIWIVGASSGIGAALTQKFATETGAGIIVSARGHAELKTLAHASDHIHPLPLDVTAPADIDAALDQMEKDYGLPDLVILAAAMYEPMAAAKLSRETIGQHVTVNYMGVVNCLDPLLAKMQARGSGEIAVVASVAGYRGLPRAGAYGPTKAALINLCETLRAELQDTGICIRLINPGFVKTRLTEKNDFKMPYLQTPREAANAIFNGLTKNDDFEIAFPKPFIRQLKIARILPYGWYFKLIRKMVGK